MFSRFIVSVLTFLGIGLSVQAIDIEYLGIDSNGDVFIVTGGIIEGDSKNLRLFIQENQRKDGVLIVFNSHGGNLNEAVSIGKYIRLQGFRTYIINECYSACFLLSSAG